MKISELTSSNLSLNEAPLPPDWDTQHFQPGSTFKARLAYALEKSKKIGTGSSRVAMEIEYQGRPTILKIAKNTKGLAQNAAEASILEDWYVSNLDLTIPLIDYDETNTQPTWIHMEKAQKANEKQICAYIGCNSLFELVQLVNAFGKNRSLYHAMISKLEASGKSEQQMEMIHHYANSIYELVDNFNILANDLGRAANWGIYNGKPVIIDVGFTKDTEKYYS